MKKILAIFADGFIYKNPLFVALLGTCAALAVTTSATNAIGMGVAVTVSLICSNVLISLMRKIIPSQIRIAAFVVIISAFVTSIEMLIKAFLPALDKSLGIFIPLIVVNCIIFARAEAFASKNTVVLSALDGLVMGGGYTFALVCVGLLRELLGMGSLFGKPIFVEEGEVAIAFFISPAGAFVTLGCLIAAMTAIINKVKYNKTMKETDTRLPKGFESTTVLRPAEILNSSSESSAKNKTNSKGEE